MTRESRSPRQGIIWFDLIFSVISLLGSHPEAGIAPYADKTTLLLEGVNIFLTDHNLFSRSEGPIVELFFNLLPAIFGGFRPVKGEDVAALEEITLLLVGLEFH